MTEKPKKAYNWLSSVLTGWGLSESWAKILAGAIIGAAIAAGVLTLPSCSVEYTQNADGIRYHGTVVPVERSAK